MLTTWLPGLRPPALLLAGVRVERSQAGALQAILFSDTLGRIKAFQKAMARGPEVAAAPVAVQQHRDRRRERHGGAAGVGMYGEDQADGEAERRQFNAQHQRVEEPCRPGGQGGEAGRR